MSDVKQKIQLYANYDVKCYLVEQSKAYGMSISSVINMMIANYRMQQQAINFLNSNPNIVADLKALADKKGCL